MAETKQRLPVFLPDNHREWKEIKGMATISDTGEINIVLENPMDAADLVRYQRNGSLIALAFDYIPIEPKTPVEDPDA